MIAFYEEPPRRNGTKTWLYCINRDLDINQIRKTDPVDMHYHDHVELLYAIDADASVWIGNKCYKFMTGDLVIIPAREPHDLTFSGNSKMLCVKFSPQILYADENSVYEFQYAYPFLYKEPPRTFFGKKDIAELHIDTLASEIWREWARKENGYELVIRADLLKIIAVLFRKFSVGERAIQLSDVVQKALDYIADHYPVATEKQAAELCGLSYNHFSAVFKKETGRNFRDCLLEVKLVNAKARLVTTKDSVTEIAFATGFSDASHFITRFKAFTGFTPKQYRVAKGKD